jgi:DNA-binding protein YbaB
MRNLLERLDLMSRNLSTLNRQTDRILKKVKPKRATIKQTTVAISKDGTEVTIDCPKDTKIFTECWYTEDTRMSEQWIVGSDNMATFLKQMEQLEDKFYQLEKQLKI